MSSHSRGVIGALQSSAVICSLSCFSCLRLWMNLSRVRTLGALMGSIRAAPTARLLGIRLQKVEEAMPFAQKTLEREHRTNRSPRSAVETVIISEIRNAATRAATAVGQTGTPRKEGFADKAMRRAIAGIDQFTRGWPAWAV